MRRRIARSRSRGQASVEFTLVAMFFFVLVTAVLAFSIGFFERSNINQALSTLGTDFPSGWRDMGDEELVLAMLGQNPAIDLDRVTVRDARVVVDDSGKVDAANSVSQAVGAQGATVSSGVVTVYADISYRYADLLSFFGVSSLTTSVRRSYTVEQTYEMS